ncbi:hypothetical protein LTR10_010236 [Elasticomyces elasticus]|nr:hypothetical protein LTR10_010236 [Elasticomyces elasticus]KAK4972140.1 hypothetical protein LTR42_006646 [Elasticomyces elasticus]
MTLADTQKPTAEDFIKGYNEWTIDGPLRARSAECLPASLGRPDSMNEDYKHFFQSFSGMMSEFKVT